MKKRKWSDILCDKIIPIRLISEFHKTVVRPTRMYDSECWAQDRKMKQKMSNAEIRMFR